MIKKIIISILSLLILSCDSSDSLNISVLLEECTSSIDNIEYESSLYNCGDLEFLNEFSEYNLSFSNMNILNIGTQNWSASGRLLDLILYESYPVDFIPTSIENLDALLLLDLSADNQSPGHLDYIPSEIGELTNLLELYLNYNNLTSLPESIGNLSNLEELNVSYNKLEILPESIENLENLEVLSLHDNLLISLSENLCNLDTSCEIDISDNLLCDEFYYSCFENFVNFNWNWQNQEECH